LNKLVLLKYFLYIKIAFFFGLFSFNNNEKNIKYIFFIYINETNDKICVYNVLK